MIIDELAAINRVLAGDNRPFTLGSSIQPLGFHLGGQDGQDSEAAQDIAQEAFAGVALWPIFARIRLLHLVSAIAINKALTTAVASDACRGWKKYQRVARRRLRPRNRSPWEEVWRMRKQIQALPDIYRRVIYQYYFQERSYREIAQNEGITVKAVESRLYRAKALLRKSMAGGDGNVSAP